MATVCEWFGLKTNRTVFTGLALKLVATVSDGLASKPAATISSGLTSKPAATVFSGLASKLVATVSSGLTSKPTVGFLVEPQNRQLRFDDLRLKITAMDSWFEPQNQVDFGLSVGPQNRQMEVGVGHASRSSGLLHVEAGLTRVSQSDLKTDGGTTAGGARDTITKVTSDTS
jgi:hypothetical protein